MAAKRKKLNNLISVLCADVPYYARNKVDAIAIRYYNPPRSYYVRHLVLFYSVIGRFSAANYNFNLYNLQSDMVEYMLLTCKNKVPYKLLHSWVCTGHFKLSY